MLTAVAEAPQEDSGAGGILDGIKYDQLMELVYHAGFRMHQLLAQINMSTLEDLIVEGEPSSEEWRSRDDGYVGGTLEMEYERRSATVERLLIDAKDIQEYLAGEWEHYD